MQIDAVKMKMIGWIATVALLQLSGQGRCAEDKSRETDRSPRVARSSLLSKYEKMGKKIMYDGHYQSSKRNDEHVDKKLVNSDTMMLLSIAEKKYVHFTKRRSSKGKRKKYLSTGLANSVKEKDRTFVTETITYGRFKIRLEGYGKYLCAKHNGRLIFKDDPLISSGKRVRQRCLFHWQFTKQMHVRLSVTSKNVTWHLFARNGRVSLARAKEANELEQSFIWLPTNRRGAARTTNGQNNRQLMHNARSSDLVDVGVDPASTAYAQRSSDSVHFNDRSSIFGTTMKKTIRIGKDDLVAAQVLVEEDDDECSAAVVAYKQQVETLRTTQQQLEAKIRRLESQRHLSKKSKRQKQ